MNNHLGKSTEITPSLPSPERINELLQMDLEDINPLWKETRERFIAAFGELQTAIILHNVLPEIRPGADLKT